LFSSFSPNYLAMTDKKMIQPQVEKYFLDNDRWVEKAFAESVNKKDDTTFAVPARLCFLDREEFKLGEGVARDPFRNVTVNISSNQILEAIDLVQRQAPSQAPFDTLIDAFVIIAAAASLYTGPLYRQPTSFAFRLGEFDGVQLDNWTEKNMIGLKQSEMQYEKLVVPIAMENGKNFALIEMTNSAANMGDFPGEIAVHHLYHSGKIDSQNPPVSAIINILKNKSGVSNEDMSVTYYDHLSEEMQPKFGDSSAAPALGLAWLLKMTQWSMSTIGLVKLPLRYMAPGSLDLREMWAEVKLSLVSRILILTNASRKGAAFPRNNIERLTSYDAPFLRVLPQEYVTAAVKIVGIQDVKIPYTGSAAILPTSTNISGLLLTGSKMQQQQQRRQKSVVEVLDNIDKEFKNLEQPRICSSSTPSGNNDNRRGNVGGFYDFLLDFFSTPRPQGDDEQMRDLESLRDALQYGDSPEQRESFVQAIFGDRRTGNAVRLFNPPADLQKAIEPNPKDYDIELYEIQVSAFFAGTLIKEVLRFVSDLEGSEKIKKTIVLFDVIYSRQRVANNEQLVTEATHYYRNLLALMTVDRKNPWTENRVAQFKSIMSVRTIDRLAADKEAQDTRVDKWIDFILIGGEFENQYEMSIVFLRVILELHAKLVKGKKSIFSKIAAYFRAISESDDNESDSTQNYGRTELRSQSESLIEYSKSCSDLAKSLLAFFAKSGTGDDDKKRLAGNYSPRMILSNLVDSMVAVVQSFRKFLSSSTVIVDRYLHSIGTQSNASIENSRSRALAFAIRRGGDIVEILESMFGSMSFEERPSRRQEQFIEKKQYVLSAPSSADDDGGADDEEEFYLSTPPGQSSTTTTAAEKQISRVILVSYDQTYSPKSARNNISPMVTDLLIDGNHTTFFSFIDNLDEDKRQQMIHEANEILKAQKLAFKPGADDFQMSLHYFVHREFQGLLRRHRGDREKISKHLSELFAARLAYCEIFMRLCINVQKKKSSSLDGDQMVHIDQLAMYSAHVYVMVIDPVSEQIYWTGVGNASPFVSVLSSVTEISRSDRLRMLASNAKMLESTVMTDEQAKKLNEYKKQIANYIGSQQKGILLFSSPAAIQDRIQKLWKKINEIEKKIDPKIIPLINVIKMAEQNLQELENALEHVDSESKKKLIKIKEELSKLNEKNKASLKGNDLSEYDKIGKYRSTIRFLIAIRLSPSLVEGSKKDAIAKLIESSPTLSKIINMWKQNWSSLLTRLSLIQLYWDQQSFDLSRPAWPEVAKIIQRLVTALSSRIVMLGIDADTTHSQRKAAIIQAYKEVMLLSSAAARNNDDAIAKAKTTEQLISALLKSIPLGGDLTVESLIESTITSNVSMMIFFVRNARQVLGDEEAASLEYHLQMIGTSPKVEVETPPYMRAIVESLKIRRRIASETMITYLRNRLAQNPPVVTFRALIKRNMSNKDQETSQQDTNKAVTTMILKYLSLLSSRDTVMHVTSFNQEGSTTFLKEGILRLYKSCTENPDLYFSQTENTFQVYTNGDANYHHHQKDDDEIISIDKLCIAALAQETLIYAPIDDSDVERLSNDVKMLSYEKEFFELVQPSYVVGSNASSGLQFVNVYPLDVKEKRLNDQNYLNQRKFSDAYDPLQHPWPLIDAFSAGLFVERSKLKKLRKQLKKSLSESSSTNIPYDQIVQAQIVRNLYEASKKGDFGKKLLAVFPATKMFGGLFIKDADCPLPSETSFYSFLFDNGVPMIMARIIAKQFFSSEWKDAQSILGFINMEQSVSHGAFDLRQGAKSLIFPSGMVREAESTVPHFISQTVSDSVSNQLFKIRKIAIDRACERLVNVPQDVPTRVILGYVISKKKGLLHMLPVPPMADAPFSQQIRAEIFSDLKISIANALFKNKPSDYFRDGAKDIVGVIGDVLDEFPIAGMVDFFNVIAKINEEVFNLYSLPKMDTPTDIENEIIRRAKIILENRNKAIAFAQIVAGGPDKKVITHPYDKYSDEGSHLNGEEMAAFMFNIDPPTPESALVEADVAMAEEIVLRLYATFLASIEHSHHMERSGGGGGGGGSVYPPGQRPEDAAKMPPATDSKLNVPVTDSDHYYHLHKQSIVENIESVLLAMDEESKF
jgi:hypothetical protein